MLEISDLKEKAWAFDVMLDGKKAASALSQERPTGDAVANITPLYSADQLRAAVAAEREACAAQVQGWNTAMTDKLAAEIRARGAKVSKTEGDDRGA